MKLIRLLIFIAVGAWASNLNTFATSPPAGGLQLWLKADAGVSTNASGHVTGWTDQSGNGRDLTGLIYGGGNPQYQPAYVASAVNGKPALFFDNGADGFVDALTRDNADVNTMWNASQLSMFIVKSQNTFDGDTTLQLNSPDDAFNRVNFHLSYFGTMYFDYGDITAGGRISGGVPSGWLGNFHILDLYRNGGDGQINVDWRRAVTGTFTDSLGPTSAARLALIPGAGDIAEILIYDHALSGPDRETVLSYLSDKYAIIPEPSFVALLGVGVLLLWRRRTDQIRNAKSEIRNKSE